MLSQLSIFNFAIIKQLEITLQEGLNILSGETGAGKSIIINAMNLILGGRASAELIRSGSNEARVEALFVFAPEGSLKDMLWELGFPFEGELLIKRTIYREGRNRIFINGSMATLQVLSRLGDKLVSISGQREHQFLLKPENHLRILDDFANLSEEREALNKAFEAYQSLLEDFRKVEREIEAAEEKQDLVRFQIEEIERAALTPGEDEALEEEKRRLDHAEELKEIMAGAYETLYEHRDSVHSSLSQTARRVEKGAHLDGRLVTVRDALSEIEARLEDACLELRELKETIQMDPRRLEHVVERLEAIRKLKRKYGSTLEEVLKFRDERASLVVNLEAQRERLGRLEKERLQAEKALLAQAQALSQKRKQAALSAEKAVEEELHHLQMAKTRFRVNFHEAGDDPRTGQVRMEDLGPDGLDRVEFMISPNVGEELRPLARIASGGELSRIILALKTILARTASVETVIFDEVDAGISGATAEVVGEKLLSLAGFHQVLCITHLPQIASQGPTHFLVKKEVVRGRTETAISRLDPAPRVQEIARLLGGREITPRALAHAREMLGGAP